MTRLHIKYLTTSRTNLLILRDTGFSYSPKICFHISAIVETRTLGEVEGMPKLGQSRKSRLRRHGKEWKKSVHGDLKL